MGSILRDYDVMQKQTHKLCVKGSFTVSLIDAADFYYLLLNM